MALPKTNDLTAYYIGKESTFGIGVAPTRHIKETGGSAILEQQTVESRSRLGSRWANGPIRVGELGKLSLPVEWDPDNLQIALALLTGNETVTGSSDPYTHTFTPLNSSTLPSASVTYLLGGWIKRRAVGVVVNQLSMEISPQQIVTGTIEAVYKTETDQVINLAAADFDATNDEINKTAHGLTNGTQVKLFANGSATFPGNVKPDKTYYVVNASANSFQLSLTSNGPAIDIGTGASGNFHLVVQETLQPTDELPFTYNDAEVKFDGVAFGELRSASLTFANNLNTDDFRFNLQGQIYAIRAGKFDATGSLTIVYNEDSYSQWAKLKNQTETDVEIKLNFSATRQLTIALPRVRYQSANVSTDGDLTVEFQIMHVAQAPTFTLLNGVSNAF